MMSEKRAEAVIFDPHSQSPAEIREEIKTRKAYTRIIDSLKILGLTKAQIRLHKALLDGKVQKIYEQLHAVDRPTPLETLDQEELTTLKNAVNLLTGVSVLKPPEPEPEPPGSEPSEPEPGPECVVLLVCYPGPCLVRCLPLSLVL